MIYVKTVYDVDQNRQPNICLYHNDNDAKTFVRTALRWGIGIESCGIIGDERARKEIASGAVDFDEVKD